MADAAARDIQSRAKAVLATSAIYDLRGVQVERDDNRLVISGLVSRFYHKQLAQELVLGACRGVRLINAIDVQ